MTASGLNTAVATVPAGAWAVGVSGGADSVALLALLRERNDLSLHVAHLNHETRGVESDDDAKFVAGLAGEWNLPCTIARRSEIEPAVADLPGNPSARYRALRLALFRQIVEENGLSGVILAHHADDQAETVLHRLIRGSGYAGLAGMATSARVGGLLILRPLLSVRRAALREYLGEQGISWREDQSNASEKYLRNRIRKLLAARPDLFAEMLNLREAISELRDWVRSTAPTPGEEINSMQLMSLPQILAEEFAREWLVDRGVPIGQADSHAIGRLLVMAGDAASAARLDFAGGVHVRRFRRGIIRVEK